SQCESRYRVPHTIPILDCVGLPVTPTKHRGCPTLSLLLGKGGILTTSGFSRLCLRCDPYSPPFYSRPPSSPRPSSLFPPATQSASTSSIASPRKFKTSSGPAGARRPHPSYWSPLTPNI